MHRWQHALILSLSLSVLCMNPTKIGRNWFGQAVNYIYFLSLLALPSRLLFFLTDL